MLSYRHSYHAGNFADVLKHLVQVAVLDHLRLKDKPFLVHDTHGGAGLFAVDDAHMQKTGEYRDGIGRLWERRFEASLINRYLNVVAGFSRPGALSHYPGSPAISAALLRDQDRLQITELHSTDFELLEARFGADRRIRVAKQDALAGIKALLPPAHKRGLVLIDPSYELGGDEAATLEAVEEGLRRFNTGCFAIWYPVLERRRADRFAQRLMALAPKHLRAELCVLRDGGARGMTGSGMVVLNPPWTLGEQLQAALPILHRTLDQGGGGQRLVVSS
ncbi:23S rRNA (adenine(2030)-N(6))-methyltransferase RlmJ [Alloalcanivorax gelatiniphagus]|uniref:Ribosomal RNA large subunit methyltransferase J n=1 Tax=Alloalcanivorax gelatiniphagus TaxID=1194167 RepID=A0ABY2XIG8_9GAMM|nr:23S rRNA (adenine(2030)-N(6))-methyltransferase RlmJ [Alloalcanivorax gelatiniphagus]TMW11628.1 23S rRNA (adenine(2030)-N(6))-methyltransferase RlmJ [Alloalcanivorax gelatiniphagus]|tara:strand:- start:21473 stop:22303 length:831 start_codon:yes stop_codon:yes gene_type:complete